MCRPVHSVGYRRCTVTVYITSGTMASGDAGGSRPRVDRSGVSFRCELMTSWNTPKSYVNLDTPGVVELDTSTGFKQTWEIGRFSMITRQYVGKREEKNHYGI